MKQPPHSSLARFSLATCAMICGLVAVSLFSAVAHADYRLGTGDKLNISVFGQKQLESRTSVNIEGKIWLPAIGMIDAAGRTLDEVRTLIGKSLTESSSIRAEDINVEIVEFRPFYIIGSVAKPGEYAYRPGLNVRQAIAVAGGFARADANELEFMAQLEPRASYAAIKSDYLHRHARLARLRAEFSGARSFSWSPPEDLQISPEQQSYIEKLERAEFDAREQAFSHEASNFERLVQLALIEIETLASQNDRLQKEDQRVTRSLSQLRDLQSRGVVSTARIDSYERDVFSSRYALDSTRSQLAGARRFHAELVGKKQGLQKERMAQITKEISQASGEVDALRSQMQSAASRLELTGRSIDRLCNPWTKKEGTFINRRSGTENTIISATADTPVFPGDTVEVNVVSAFLRAQCGAHSPTDGDPAASTPGAQSGN